MDTLVPRAKKRNACCECGDALGHVGAGASVPHISVLRLMNECTTCKAVVCRKCKHGGRHVCKGADMNTLPTEGAAQGVCKGLGGTR
jgi:hypothetical protein